MRRLTRFIFLAQLALALVASPAGAQSAEELQAAGQAFQEGQRAQMRGDYAQAAEMFDLANHTAPSAAALRSAIRMHQSAGHHAAAATRAAHSLATYPNDTTTVELASQVIAGCGPLTSHVVITCEPTCALTVGARVVSASTTHADLYLDPGTHVVRATWADHRSLERTLEAEVGSNQELALHSNGPEVVASETTTAVPPTEEISPSEAQAHDAAPLRTASSSGLSPAFFAVAVGLTVAWAATTIGLGVDMLAARDRYALMPTEAGWRDGVGRETATNALLGTSLALAAITVGLAIFTDWDGEPSTPEGAFLHHVRFAASPDGRAARLGLTF